MWNRVVWIARLLFAEWTESQGFNSSPDKDQSVTETRTFLREAAAKNPARLLPSLFLSFFLSVLFIALGLSFPFFLCYSFCLFSSCLLSFFLFLSVAIDLSFIFYIPFLCPVSQSFSCSVPLFYTLSLSLSILLFSALFLSPLLSFSHSVSFPVWVTQCFHLFFLFLCILLPHILPVCCILYILFFLSPSFHRSLSLSLPLSLSLALSL